MRAAAHGGAYLHAPDHGRTALLGAYCGGAQVLGLDLRLTKDGHVVAFRDEALPGPDGAPVASLPLSEVRKHDIAAAFSPPGARPGSFRYHHTPTHKVPVETLADLLDELPDDVELVLSLRAPGAALVDATLQALQARGLERRAVVTGARAEDLRRARRRVADLRLAVEDPAATVEQRLQALVDAHADGVVCGLDELLDARGTLTDAGRLVERASRERALRVGAIVRTPPPGVPEPALRQELARHAFAWSLETASLIDAGPWPRRALTLVEESFAGTRLDRERFALGYAKANPYARVEQRDGVRITIGKYTGDLPGGGGDALERRLRAIENALTFAARDWPYYSGGGVGLRRGIKGDFAAEVSYTVREVGQATTLEMAVLNVDPGAHRGEPPRSFRDKDSFYDPHGAPPYVGVEHDEDDGFRINWNLGVEYDNNQYGRPVGDGRTPRAADLRLERRGPFFAAYYRNAVDAPAWVCVGVTRNDSLNPVVYLRCVAKRWRQEREDDPDQFHPILENEYVFSDLRVHRWL